MNPFEYEGQQIPVAVGQTNVRQPIPMPAPYGGRIPLAPQQPQAMRPVDEFIPATEGAIPLPQAPQPAYIPVVERQTTVEPGVAIPQEIRDQIAKSDADQIAARNEMVAAQNRAMATQAEYHEKMIAERNRIADEQAATREKAKKDVELAESNYKEVYNDAKNSQINPDRFFDGRVENKVMAALLAGAGAWSAAMTGGKNYALEIINQAIDDDITAQKIAMARKDKFADDARRNYELAKDRFGNADAAYKVMRLEAVQAMGDKLMTQANNEVTRANLAAQNAQIAGMLARGKMELYQASSAKSRTTTNVKTVEAGGQESVSERMRKQSEANVALEWSNTLKTVMESFDKAGSVKFIEGKAPQFIPGSKKIVSESESANIAAQLIGKVPGIRSDKDFERIIIPLLPTPGDTVQSVKYKREAFKSFLDSSAPAAYLKTQDQKTYTPKTFKGEGR